jgi:hypothetical protein
LSFEEFLLHCEKTLGMAAARLDLENDPPSSRFIDAGKLQLLGGYVPKLPMRTAPPELPMMESTISIVAPLTLPAEASLDFRPPLPPILSNCFSWFGEVSNTAAVLAMHPAVLAHMSSTHRVIMVDDAALPRTWRAYLGIMAASRCLCRVVVLDMTWQFLALGGNPDWLKGLDHPSVPATVRALDRLNALLAHRPWLVTADVIREVVEQSDDGTSITVNQLAHAIVVLTTVHSLSCLVLALGVNPEADAVIPAAALGVTDPRLIPFRAEEPVASVSFEASSPRLAESDSVDPAPAGAPHVIEAVRAITRTEPEAVTASSSAGDDAASAAAAGKPPTTDPAAVPTPSKKDKREKKEKKPLPPPPPSADPEDREGGMWAKVYAQFAQSPGLDFRYEDFFYSQDSPALTLDAGFAESSFAVLARFFPEVAQPLGNELALAFRLTYHTFSESKSLDTTPYRNAVWAYVSLLFGVMAEGFEFPKMNEIVHKPVKAMAKLIAVFPDSITREAFVEFSGLYPEEKVHIAILVSESRKQAAITFACLALKAHYL